MPRRLPHEGCGFDPSQRQAAGLIVGAGPRCNGCPSPLVVGQVWRDGAQLCATTAGTPGRSCLGSARLKPCSGPARCALHVLSPFRRRDGSAGRGTDRPGRARGVVLPKVERLVGPACYEDVPGRAEGQREHVAPLRLEVGKQHWVGWVVDVPEPDPAARRRRSEGCPVGADRQLEDVGARASQLRQEPRAGRVDRRPERAVPA